MYRSEFEKLLDEQGQKKKEIEAEKSAKIKAKELESEQRKAKFDDAPLRTSINTKTHMSQMSVEDFEARALEAEKHLIKSGKIRRTFKRSECKHVSPCGKFFYFVATGLLRHDEFNFVD